MDYQNEIQRGEAGLVRLLEQQATIEATVRATTAQIAQLRIEISEAQLRFDVGDVTDDGVLNALKEELQGAEANLEGARAVQGDFAERIRLVRSEVALRRYQRDCDDYAALCEFDLGLQNNAARALLDASDAFGEARRHFKEKSLIFRRIENYRNAEGLPPVVERGETGVPHVRGLDMYFGNAEIVPSMNLRRALQGYLGVEDEHAVS